MGFNKNFVVKNGLQVSDYLLYASDTNDKVGINTNLPSYDLEVFGGIGATSLYVSLGSTFSSISVSGFSTFVEDANFSNTVSAARLTVSSASTFSGHINAASTLSVSGASTFSSYNNFNGISTFSQYVNFQNDVNVSGVVTATTFIGNLTGTASTAIDLSGGTITASSLSVSGISTLTNGPLFVGSASTTGTDGQVIQATGGVYVSGNLGVGDTNPTAKLRVNGDGSFTGVITAVTFSGNLSGTAVTATSFDGDLTGDVTGNLTGTASTSNSIGITTNLSTATATYPLLISDTTIGPQTVFIDNVDLSYNANTGALSATTFIGNLTGTASTSTFAGVANTTNFITASDESSDTTCFPLFSTDSTGDISPKTDASSLTYNSSSGTLSAVGFAGTFFANGLSNFASNTIENLAIKNYSETVNSIGNTTTASTIDLSEGNFVTATLTGTTTFTFNTGITTGAAAFTLILSQDGVGNHTVTWPVTVNWPQGSTPGVTTTANATDIWVFFSPDNGSTWYGNITHSNIF